jgi:hypothetical protein
MEPGRIDPAGRKTPELQNPMGGAEVSTIGSWQLIFKLSKVNNGAYHGDQLPSHNWPWPRETWLQKRLRYLRESTGSDTKTSVTASGVIEA